MKDDASQLRARNTAEMNQPVKPTISLLPMTPYRARVITEPDVPAAGPLTAMMPVKIHGSEPTMITSTACHSSSPSSTIVAPIVKFRMLTFGAAQTENRSRARPCRSDAPMSSIPRVSGCVGISTNCWFASPEEPVWVTASRALPSVCCSWVCGIFDTVILSGEPLDVGCRIRPLLVMRPIPCWSPI